MHVDIFPGPSWLIKTSGYGQRVDPLGRGAGFHGGVDYGSPNPGVNPICGAPIYAPWDGFVASGSEAGGAGNWIWVTADNRLFKAFHLTSYVVRSGRVVAGTHIGNTGTTGASTGCHNHWELWQNGVRIDPESSFEDARQSGRFVGTPVTPTTPVEWLDTVSETEVERIVVRAMKSDEVTSGIAKKSGFALSGDARVQGHSWAPSTDLRTVIEESVKALKDQLDPKGEGPIRSVVESTNNKVR